MSSTSPPSRRTTRRARRPASFAFGAGRDFSSFVLITVGTAIGGGLVLDGKVYRGWRGFAGEIGHLCVNHDGLWCNCGSRGCLEQYASGTAMLRVYAEKLRKRGQDPDGSLTARDVVDRAKAGDPCARDTVEEAGMWIAQAFGSLLNVLDVEACIVGGGVSEAGEILLEPIRRHLPDQCWPQIGTGVVVRAAELRNDAGILGAAAQAYERLATMTPFQVNQRDPCSGARTGSLALGHGTVTTPCFMPVGTNASVKAMRYDDLEEIGVNLILSNTYHLYLRPGTEVIRDSRGLHNFMGWPHNILTDSGGYQIFSLASFRTVEDEGVSFRSHIDGSAHRLTPRDVIDIQGVLGSDVLMPLDECTAPGVGREDAERAVRRTSSWLQGSAERWRRNRETIPGLLFGIMQGNFYRDLRHRSAQEIAELDLPGYAIGGLSVGEGFAQFSEFLHFSSTLLPGGKPRYLMGIGTPAYILEAVEAGIDLFDCVYPTRTARNAQVLTPDGPLSLRNEKFRRDTGPIDPECACYTCRRHTRSYLRHLFKAREIQAAVLATCHNLAFIQKLVADIRAAIQRGTFPGFKRAFLLRYDSGEA